MENEVLRCREKRVKPSLRRLQWRVFGAVAALSTACAGATQAHERLIDDLAQRPETSNATMLHDRHDAITGAVDELHETVCDAYLVSGTHEIAAV